VATIIPFRALRPAKDKASKVTASPDSGNREHALEEINSNPCSYLHVVKPYLHFPGESKDPEKHYPFGRKYLEKLIKDHVLIKDEEPSFYIYQNIKGSKAYTGVIACAAVDDYLNDRILKHENTRTEKQEELFEHIRYIRNIGCPVLLTYADDKHIDEVVEEVTKRRPEYNFISSDQVKHNLWVVNDPAMMKQIAECFSNKPELYIADGHHRTAGSAAYCQFRRNQMHSYTGHEDFNFFPVCLIPFSRLKIYEYHRLIRDPMVNSPDFLEKCAKHFEISPCGDLPFQPLKKQEFGLYFHHNGYMLHLRKESAKLLKGVLDKLDVSIAEKFILSEIFNITDSKTDPRLSFMDGSKGIGTLQSAVDSGEYDIAITLYPTSVDEMIEVADNHLIMPQNQPG
jgi:uncharacterized protein (DUF1015 family)